ncbi:MAG: Error-prone repair protein ImuA [Bacteroidetes bacterium]|nr:Error-prone repair protein ImuA [Bacteroidota bacterium]
MLQAVVKNDIITLLKNEVYALQGFKKPLNAISYNRLGPIEAAFPNNIFPTGVIHELISPSSTAAAATNGFITGLLSGLSFSKGTCLWISNKRTVFPSSLKAFGIAPERIVFVDLIRQKDVLWAMEEALKCTALSAVIGELSELNFIESRRLQLAVEQSHVTGFIHRYSPKTENVVACVSRWKVKPLPGAVENGMPGVGHPRWKVELLKVRNGIPGSWNIEWVNKRFQYIEEQAPAISDPSKRKAS